MNQPLKVLNMKTLNFVLLFLSSCFAARTSAQVAFSPKPDPVPGSWGAYAYFPVTVSRTHESENPQIAVRLFLNRQDGNGFVAHSAVGYGFPFTGVDGFDVDIEVLLPGVNAGTSWQVRLEFDVQGSHQPDSDMVLTLIPHDAQGFVLAPNPVETGLQDLTGTFTLNTPAPAGGVVVFFSTGSGETRLLSMSAGANTVAAEGGVSFIRIPEGQTQATATWQAPPRVNSVTANLHARIFRDGFQEQFNDSVTLNPAVTFADLSISVSKSLVMHGEEFEVTVTLPAPAPAGGFLIQLDAAGGLPAFHLNPGGLPSSLYVAEGETEATHSFEAFHLGANIRNAQLFAAYAGPAAPVISATTPLSVRPVGHQYFWSVSPDFPETVYQEDPDEIWPIMMPISLSEPAPPGGFSFSIGHDLPDGIAGTWPQTATIPEGQTGIHFELPMVLINNQASGTVTVTPLSPELTPQEPLELPLAIVPLFEPERNQVSLSLSAATFDASMIVTLTVSIEDPAPAGGALVLLDFTEEPVFMTFPWTVMIPEGETQVQVQLQASCNPGTQTGTITAEYDFTDAEIPFTRVPIAYQPVVTVRPYSPHPARCDRPVLYKVELSDPAPAGGIELELGGIEVITPPTVRVEEGEIIGLFPLALENNAEAPQVAAVYYCVGDEYAVDIEATGPLTITSFSFSATQIIGPATAWLQIQINQPAPVHGLVIPLNAAPAHLVDIPSYVVIPEGEVFVSVPVLLEEPMVSQVITANAILCGIWSNSLTLNPPQPIRLVDLLVSPHTLAAGTPATGTVTLNTAAPAGGTLVQIRHFYPGATMPDSVLVPQGFNTADFPIQTYATCRQESRVIVQALLNQDLREGFLNIGSPACPGFSGVGTAEEGPIPAGGTATVQIQLNSPAPPGGMLVSISTPDDRLDLPGSVVIAGGSSTVEIPVNIPHGCYPEPVTLRISTPQTTHFLPLHIVDVNCVNLTAFSVTPMASNNGEVLTGTLELEQAAPPGGIDVQLRTFFDRRVVIPPVVHIPAGQSSVTFPIPTKLSNREDRGEIVAKLGATELTATVDIGPAVGLPLRHELILSPTVQLPGENVYLTVQLSAPAPAGGLPVSLGSTPENVFSNLPPTLLIPEGESHATLTLSVDTVVENLPVQVKAEYFHAPVYQTLTVNGHPWSRSGDFASWRSGALSPAQMADPELQSPFSTLAEGSLPLFAFYAFGGSAETGSLAQSGTQIEFVADEEGRPLVGLSFPWPRFHPDLAYRIQCSTNLIDWVDLPQDNSFFQESPGESHGTMRVFQPASPRGPGVPPVFYRIQAVYTE